MIWWNVLIVLCIAFYTRRYWVAYLISRGRMRQSLQGFLRSFIHWALFTILSPFLIFLPVKVKSVDDNLAFNRSRPSIFMGVSAVIFAVSLIFLIPCSCGDTDASKRAEETIAYIAQTVIFISSGIFLGTWSFRNFLGRECLPYDN